MVLDRYGVREAVARIEDVRGCPLGVMSHEGAGRDPLLNDALDQAAQARSVKPSDGT